MRKSAWPEVQEESILAIRAHCSNYYSVQCVIINGEYIHNNNVSIIFHFRSLKYNYVNNNAPEVYFI